MEESSESRVPVFLVTGFLGSGKTTLISALLNQSAMKGTAVIVNEFGAVGIDNAIFAESLDPRKVLLLANGCLCCTAGDDLTATIGSLAQSLSDRPERIVIETTGLADPVPVILRLMADTRLQQMVRIAGVVTTVDAINGSANLDRDPVAVRQAAIADRRIVTKADLAEPSAVEALSARLIALNPGASVGVVVNGNARADEIFDTSLFDPFRDQTDPRAWMRIDAFKPAHMHGAGEHGSHETRLDRAEPVRTWLVEQEGAVDWAMLSPRIATIVGRYGDALLRLKGMIHTVDDPRPLVLHSVQRLFHPPTRLSRWNSEPRSTVVVIGEPSAEIAVDALRGSLNEAALADTCGVTQQPRLS